jgi:hypothetical protein
MSEIHVQDLSSNHIYRTELPNLIFELGLDPYELSAYAAIKRAAGDKGQCIKSYDTLAIHAGMCRRKLIPIIDKLCLINPILGKSLITKAKRLTEVGNSSTNLIQINDIWPDNFDHFKKQIGGAQYAPRGAQDALGGVHGVHGGGAWRAPKEEPFKKNPIKKEDIARSEAKPPPSKDFIFDHQENKFNGITSQDKETWKTLYPDIDMDKEILKAEQWCISNPSRSNKKLWRKFLTGWFQKANEWAFNRKAYASQSKQTEDRRTKNADGKPVESPSTGRF